MFTCSTDSSVVGGMFLATSLDNSGVLYGGGAFYEGNLSVDDNETITVSLILNAGSVG